MRVSLGNKCLAFSVQPVLIQESIEMREYLALMQSRKGGEWNTALNIFGNATLKLSDYGLDVGAVQENTRDQVVELA